MERRRKKATGKAKPTTVSNMMDRLGAASKAGIKSLPYAVAVGATQGALKGLMERFRTHPYLAPLDVRVRPDILESGLRTAVASLKDKGIERIEEITELAESERRPIKLEEYREITSLAKLPKTERKAVLEMAEGLETLRGRPESMPDVERIERQIDGIIANHLADTVKEEIARSKPFVPAPAKRQIARTKAKADLPAYEIGPKEKSEAERLLLEIKRKKQK
jgi:hypothetical protein